jgi:hypothetical protein
LDDVASNIRPALDSGGVSRASGTSSTSQSGGGVDGEEEAARAKLPPAPTLADVAAAHARYEVGWCNLEA